MMELHLKIIGWLLIILALIHVSFPRYFNWKKELAELELVNRQMMQVHTFFIALVVFLMGLLCLVISPEEIGSSLGRKVALGLFVFWFLRLCIQFFWYSPKLWRGRLFETVAHIVFTMLWIYLCAVFFFLWQAGAD